MTASPSAETGSIVSRDRVTAAIRTELRTAIVVERRLTVDQLATASGVSVRAIRSYMANDAGEVREPCLSSALSIAVVLGTRCLNAILALVGYAARPLDEEDQPCPMMIAATSMGHLATIAAAAADGRIDHTEEQPVRAAADMIIATLVPLSSAGNAA